jgi:hypothetical protein
MATISDPAKPSERRLLMLFSYRGEQVNRIYMKVSSEE